MKMMEGLHPSTNVPETLSALQAKTDKYIMAKKLAKAKRRRREKEEDHKKKETNSSTVDYRSDLKSRKPEINGRGQDHDRHPRTPPHRTELMLPLSQCPYCSSTNGNQE